MTGSDDVATHSPHEAIKIAKDWILQVFRDEIISDVGLEEVRFSQGAWRITIGFSRPWNKSNFVNALAGGGASRAYKVVSINDKTGEVMSLSNREAA